jgi:hypothetical protein
MAKAKKKSPAKSAAKQVDIPPHPAVPTAKEIGEMCAEIYGYAVKSARQEGLDEQGVEQVALGDVQRFMAACIKQSKQDWKAYTKETGVHAAYVEAPAKKKAAKKKSAKKAAKKAAKKK